ncbi:potassium/proton antiporter [Idiomarina xiamenensis]|uniref:Potassium/proton antiporter n=1 Tax=Idiomarina xiamenensis 10-D-4 TaxID=740709 RepID=K2KB04_9GAMM|nr:potassium/proton antiporter [Idiomarina xiamenensis]EKE83727.1 potassium/proton antiporter [Idiomarina xiamenensis 10-D-4]
MDYTSTVILIVGCLFLFSILATVISSRLGAPLLLVFLCIGMLAGEEGLLGLKFDNPQLTFLLGSVALVIILFDGGMRTSPDRFRVALWPAISLATIGVALTCAGIATAVVFWFDLPWTAGLLLGALLSSTDAAAVFSIFQSRGLRIKDRVASTLEVESGTNDPMAVILTMTMTMAVATNTDMAPLTLIGDVAIQLIVGLLGGWLGGHAFVLAARKLPLSFTFFPLLAIASAVVIFALTSKFHGSGFLAVYLMGFIIGKSRLSQLVHILQVQDGLAWLSQIMMFLILGLLVTPSQLIAHAPLALGVALVLIFVARPLAVFLCLLPFSFPWREQVFISWVGLRGAVPIILALYPWLSGVPDEAVYFDVAFFVVLLSLLVQGWTIVPLARWLGLEVPPSPQPQQRMPLDAVPSNDALEVWEFDIHSKTPACDHTWEQLKFTAPVTFVGVLRDGEWLQPAMNPVIREGDALLVVARVIDVDAISRVLSAHGEQRKLNETEFFGDFTLRADLTIAELAAIYPVAEQGAELMSTTIADYFKQAFHRRVVVGDKVKLGNFYLTVREVSEQGEIVTVGIKSAAS